MEFVKLIFIVIAGVAVSTSTSPSHRRLAEGDIIHIENSDGQCMTAKGDVFMWTSCSDLLLRFIAPRDPTEANILRAADSQSCLAFEPYGRTGIPALRMVSCREGNINQQWQLDYSYGRDRRNQIRSMTSLGVCQEHPDTWDGDDPEYVPCPIEVSGPICIGEDDHRAVARPCKDVDQSTEANGVRNYQGLSNGGSTFTKLQKAFRNASQWGTLHFRPRPLFVLLGDSITQYGNDVGWGGQLGKSGPGWASAIQHAYQRRADVINRGYKGYNTDWVLHILPEILDGLPLPKGGHVALFTIFLGANDAVTANWTDAKGQPIKTEHVPIPRYTANLKRMVAMLRQHQPQAEIVIITPPKVSAEEASWLYYVEVSSLDRPRLLYGRPDTKRDEARTRQYAAACAETAKESGVHLLDFHAHMDSLPNWRTLLCDGLHLSGPGQHELATQLMELIITEIAHIYPWENDTGLPRDAPHAQEFLE